MSDDTSSYLSLRIDDLCTKLAAALKERDAAQAALKAAETLLELAASTHAGVVKERDDARVNEAEWLMQVRAAKGVIAAFTDERDRLHAAFAPTAENVEALRRGLAYGLSPAMVREFLVAIAARAGLP